MNSARLNLAFVAIVLISAGGFAVGMVVPGWRELESERDRIGVELDQAQQAQAAVSDMTAMYSNVLQLKEREFQLWERIPVEPRVSEFANGLVKSLATLGITQSDIQQELAKNVDETKLPETLRLASNITVLPMTIKFDANFNQVAQFLDAIAAMPRLVHVDDLRLQNNESKPGRLRVAIVLHAYHRRPM